MNYFLSYDVSLTGLSVEKTRLDLVAQNIANAHTVRTADGGPYVPMEALIEEKRFEDALGAAGAQVREIRPVKNPVRSVYKPEHPLANDSGFVEMPNMSPVQEMLTLIEAVRGYEANVQALNAAKAMLRSALEIGGKK